MTKYQPGLRISEYVLEECVGAGTFGEVWRARHHVWKNELVAVKLPTEPEYVRYLQREGVVVHGLRHPNIIRVIGLDPYADPPYLVMEFVNGPALKTVIAEHRKGMPIDVALTVLRGVLQAMMAAHRSNIVHRDLKPGNVMLHLNGAPLTSLRVEAVKVGDFGLGAEDSDALRAMVQSASMARDDQLVGTLAYMAPELKDGGHKPDAVSDLYSIGVLMFEMLTGERPAGAELPSALRPDVPMKLDNIFRGLYARRDRRFESAQAVLEDPALLSLVDPPREEMPPLPPPLPGREARARTFRCPTCRTAAAPEDQFCTQCGTQLVKVVRRCPTCHGYPRRRDQYCIFCGVALPGVED
jgi:serine/threonine protein kinase